MLASCRQARCLSTAASADVVGEMISFARDNFKTNQEQAIDVLTSGLQYMSTGPDAGRLYLAQAEIEADRNRWREVADLTRKAATAASDAQTSSNTAAESLLISEVELYAACIHARCSLAQGRDAEAFRAAQLCMEVARESFTADGAEDRRWQGLVMASSVAGMVQHASAEFVSAGESFAAVLSLAGHHDSRGGPPAERDHLVPEALKQAAAFRLSEGSASEAQALGKRATAAAEQAVSSAKGSTGVLLSPLFTGEALADSYLVQAQACMAAIDWEAAEEALSSALSAAEAVSGAVCPRVALVLLLTAQTYSRTGRVTLAEGLYREAAKMLQLKPGSEDEVELQAVHTSVGALLAWRYCQLLTAMPRRTTEAASWEKLGRALHEDAPIGGLGDSPEAVLGTLNALTGKGQAGRGVVLDMMCRRVLPCQHP
ncbi:hypothetical protein D9Q98_008543 [Chlorella vulgaris]|uniref:Uncharacterized protein n=1 Tax=Chlorella vulgaris TaxID=3077 RepID=A0A9D4YU69_CHLVU|nr:hypothetical protein D9Q98_008543 [Chlorella vulgaris]